MAALLMRWHVIPPNFVVFCNRSNFWNPSGWYATEGKKDKIKFNNNNTFFAFANFKTLGIKYRGIKNKQNNNNNCFRLWLTWATRFLNILANRSKYSFYSSGSVSWFKGSIQSSFTRLLAVEDEAYITIPACFYSLFLTFEIFTFRRY